MATDEYFDKKETLGRSTKDRTFTENISITEVALHFSQFLRSNKRENVKVDQNSKYLCTFRGQINSEGTLNTRRKCRMSSYLARRPGVKVFALSCSPAFYNAIKFPTSRITRTFHSNFQSSQASFPEVPRLSDGS